MTRIPSHSALEVLCGKKADASNWQTCTSTDPLEGMNGAIVVIGDHFGDQDVHPTVGGAEHPTAQSDDDDSVPEGMVYGVDLQANYVAALLDRRYYMPLFTPFEDNVFILVFFILLQLLFWKCKPLWLAGLAGIALWLAIFISSVGILAFSRYLVTVWVHGINLATIVVSWLEHRVAEME